MCQLLLCKPELEAVSAAIAQHATLPQFIARLLITQSLPTAAEVLEVAAGVACEGAAAANKFMTADSTWHLVWAAVESLAAPGLQPTAAPYLQEQQPALLMLAHRLVAALPTTCEDSSRHVLCSAWLQVLCLLGNTCAQVTSGQSALQQGRQLLEDRRRGTAWTIVQCLPLLAAAMPLLAATQPGGSLAALAPKFEQLLQPAATLTRIDGHPELQQLLRAADAALHISAALQPAGAVASVVTGAEAAVALEAVHVVRAAADCAHHFVASRLGPEAAELAAAAPAALQLHADVCRLLHRWAADGGATALLPEQALPCLLLSAVAAQRLLAAAEAAGYDSFSR